MLRSSNAQQSQWIVDDSYTNSTVQSDHGGKVVTGEVTKLEKCMRNIAQ